MSISLRDYFAGLAMQAELTAHSIGYYAGPTGALADEKLAAMSYDTADAMLAAREKGTDIGLAVSVAPKTASRVPLPVIELPDDDEPTKGDEVLP